MRPEWRRVQFVFRSCTGDRVSVYAKGTVYHPCPHSGRPIKKQSAPLNSSIYGIIELIFFCADVSGKICPVANVRETVDRTPAHDQQCTRAAGE